MNEQPQNIWKQPWRGGKTLLWLVLLFVAAFIIVCVIGLFAPGNANPADTVLGALVIAGVFAVTASLILLFIRWLCCARNLKRFLFGVACLLTLIALAYAVENLRGRFAWKNFEQIAAAKGERLDLASIIPPAVPDAENFAMAPLFEGVRNEMDTEWRRAHSGPGGLTNVNRFALTPFRTNGSSGALSVGGWMTAEHTDLKSWQRYYRDPRWDGTPDRTNGMTKVYGIGAPQAVPDSTNDLAMRNAFAARYGLKPAPDSSNTEATTTILNEFPTTSQPQSPSADVLLALSKYDPIVQELREAAQRPRSRFPVRYEDTYTALLPHLAKMKGAIHFFTLRAIAELDAGQAETALADVMLSFRMIESIRGEPNLISHLVRIANIHVVLQPIWEGLADRRWNDAQLAALEAELARVDFLPDYLTAVRGEGAFSLAAVDYVRRTRDWNMIGGIAEESSSVGKASGLLFLYLVPSGWFDQSKALMGRLHLELYLPAVDQAARTVSPTKVRQTGETLDKALAHRTPYNIFAAMLLPALTRSAEKFARGQTCADLARVACALERHRLAHGTYPEKLEALTPQFLAKLPHDVINGQPLKYRRTDDGRFVLCSVGWNETDDGGQTALTKSDRPDWSKGDWAWRYPAK